MGRLFTAEFYEMGGWAAYVWPSYAAFAMLLALIAWRVAHRNAQVRTQLELMEAHRQRRSAAQEGDPR